MANVIKYTEPKNYFNADMKKAAAAWEKENAKKTAQAAQKPKTAKKSK